MEAKQPKETKQNQKKPQEPKIISKMTLKNIDPNITKSTQEEILTTIKHLLKDRTDIKNIYISHYDYIYIVINFNKYFESETAFLNIVNIINSGEPPTRANQHEKKYNQPFNNIAARAGGSLLMSYTYKDNENQPDAKKLIYKYCYKPVQKTIFINDDD